MYQVKALDPDENPVLRYHIDSENSEARSEEGTIIKSSEYDYISMFELDPIKGLLKVVKLLDREKMEIIRLSLVVEDIASEKGKQYSTGKNNILNINKL